MNDRPSWNDYFFGIAEAVSKRATCSRAKVGVVFVRDNRILVTGYNGAAPGMRHCNHELVDEDLFEGHCLRSIHDVPNALATAAKHGVSLIDSIIYATHSPCNQCARLLIAVGVKQIYCAAYYPDMPSSELLKEAKIPVYTKGIGLV